MNSSSVTQIEGVKYIIPIISIFRRAMNGSHAMKNDDDNFSEEEIIRRRDDAIRRALNTPPTPQKEMVGKVGAPNRGRPRRSRPIDKGKDQA